MLCFVLLLAGRRRSKIEGHVREGKVDQCKLTQPRCTVQRQLLKVRRVLGPPTGW